MVSLTVYDTLAKWQRGRLHESNVCHVCHSLCITLYEISKQLRKFLYHPVQKVGTVGKI